MRALTPAFTDVDCLVFAGLYHLAPGVPNALKIVKPATVIRWHRAGFRAYWRKDQGRARAGHRHRLSYAGSFAMSVWPTRFWGVPRIHGELLKLGIEIGQTTVAKYMVKERRPPSQGWRTFI